MLEVEVGEVGEMVHLEGHGRQTVVAQVQLSQLRAPAPLRRVRARYGGRECSSDLFRLWRESMLERSG